MPHASSVGGDDFASTDEVKVYKDEGDDEKRSSDENLSEDKLGLVTETEEGKSVDIEGRSYSGDESSCGGSAGAKAPDYLVPDHRLPFGYPLLPPYHYSNGGSIGSPSKIFAPHPSLGFYMYGNDSAQPPPAHMGIPPLTIDPKTGLPRPSVYGIHPASGQLPHPLYGPDFSTMQCFDLLSRSSPNGFTSHYPSSLSRSPLTWFGPPGILPSHPGISHPAVVTSGSLHDLSPLSDSMDNCRRSQFFLHHRLDHHNISGRGSNNHNGAMSPEPRPKRTHIKKPLNAFMVFMKEMRQTVIDECTLKESAAINQILGRRWHALERSEQAKYYEMARKEKELHMQLYPGWSARDNYATHTKKKKLKREPRSDHGGDHDDDFECPNARKCRSRYGLEQQHQWCKHCRSDYSSASENSCSNTLTTLADSLGPYHVTRTPTRVDL